MIPSQPKDGFNINMNLPQIVSICETYDAESTFREPLLHRVQFLDSALQGVVQHGRSAWLKLAQMFLLVTGPFRVRSSVYGLSSRSTV